MRENHMTEQEVTKVLDEHRIPPAELLERIRYVLSTRRSLLAMLGELSVQSDPASDPQALETVKQVRAALRRAGVPETMSTGDGNKLPLTPAAQVDALSAGVVRAQALHSQQREELAAILKCPAQDNEILQAVAKLRQEASTVGNGVTVPAARYISALYGVNEAGRLDEPHDPKCEHCPHPIHWLSAAGQERDLVLQRIGAQALELDITMSMSTGKAPTFGEMVAMVHDLLKDGETEKAAAYLVLASRKALR
jgi:hypothetical protein